MPFEGAKLCNFLYVGVNDRKKDSQLQATEQLLEIIKSGRRLVVYLHDNPDPDAVASGWILGRIAAFLGVPYRIIFGGRIRRAENLAMVRELNIPLHGLERSGRGIRFLKTDRYALVDTQPVSGNNSFPHARLVCDIVIDHHPAQPGMRAALRDIRPDEGCCTTMLLSYLRELGMVPEANLATAAAYGIISETQDLGREATRQDREALQFLMSYVRLSALARIRHPTRKRDYYRTIARAMRQVVVSRTACICHVGPVYAAEAVAEIADFFLFMERVTWCLVTGVHDGVVSVSIRTTHRRSDAARMMKQILPTGGKGGGHGMIAGGAVPCGEGQSYSDIVDGIQQRFVKRLRHKHKDVFRPLLEGEPVALDSVETRPENP